MMFESSAPSASSMWTGSDGKSGWRSGSVRVPSVTDSVVRISRRTAFMSHPGRAPVASWQYSSIAGSQRRRRPCGQDNVVQVVADTVQGSHIDCFVHLWRPEPGRKFRLEVGTPVKPGDAHPVGQRVFVHDVHGTIRVDTKWGVEEEQAARRQPRV